MSTRTHQQEYHPHQEPRFMRYNSAILQCLLCGKVVWVDDPPPAEQKQEQFTEEEK